MHAHTRTALYPPFVVLVYHTPYEPSIFDGMGLIVKLGQKVRHVNTLFLGPQTTNARPGNEK